VIEVLADKDYASASEYESDHELPLFVIKQKKTLLEKIFSMCRRAKPDEVIVPKKRERKAKVKFENAMTKKLRHAVLNIDNLDVESQNSEQKKLVIAPQNSLMSTEKEQ
jgi:hypothetical protein